MRCGSVFSDSRRAASAAAICCCRWRSWAAALRSDLLLVGIQPLVSHGRSPFAALALAGPPLPRTAFRPLAGVPPVACALRGSRRKRGQAYFDLLRRRGAIKDAKEDLADQSGVVLFVGDEFRKLALWVGDGRFDSRSADQGHDGTKLQAAGPFTFADALPRRAAKVREEAVRQIDARIGQGRGTRSHRHARYPRDRTGGAVDGVVEHFGRQPPGDGVRIVDPVVSVPAIARRSRAGRSASGRSAAACAACRNDAR